MSTSTNINSPIQTLDPVQFQKKLNLLIGQIHDAETVSGIISEIRPDLNTLLNSEYFEIYRRGQGEDAANLFLLQSEDSSSTETQQGPVLKFPLGGALTSRKRVPIGMTVPLI